MKKILVFGLARTGISALKTLKLKGYDLGAIDDNIDEEKTKILNELDVQIETIDNIGKYDIILKSPGIRMDNPVILKANELNIEVVSDLELAQRIFEDIKIVAITGILVLECYGKYITATKTHILLLNVQASN